MTACCCATYSCRCCESGRTIAWKIYWGLSAFFSCEPPRSWAIDLFRLFRFPFGTPCCLLGLAECVIGRATVRFRSLKISPSIHFYQVHEYSRSAFSHRSSNARARNCIVGRASLLTRLGCPAMDRLKGLAKRTIVPSERPQPQPRSASETVYEQRHRHHYVPISRALRKRPRLGPS